MKRYLVASLLLTHLTTAFAAKSPDQPYGNPNAKRGGTFYVPLRKEPNTLNPFTSNDVYGRAVQNYVVESLLTRHPDTYEWVPSLAEKWEVSKDGKQFTFTLRADAKFSDGKPVTPEDVKFSFDTIFDDAYNRLTLRPYYEGLASCEILDAKTVRITAKEKYFGNFESAAGLSVFPKHVYGDAEKAKKMNSSITGSGAYMIDSYDRGNRIVLKRNPTWWGTNVNFFKGTVNFDRIWFRFQGQDNILLEMLKKGDVDYLDSYSVSPEMYTLKAVGPEWGKTAIKEKVENSTPKPYGFIGWNLKHPIFKDRNVRVAMTHLMNRQLMIEKFRFNMSVPATGPWHQFSEYASRKVKPLLFDPKKAGALLAKAGWKDSDKDGVLDKVIDGKKTDFAFTLLYAAADREKYYTMYKEDLKKAGIKMDLKLVEWNTFDKLLHERKFDAVTLGWGGGSVDLDPKQIWHSESDSEYGSNFISYHNPEVDKLIDEARAELNKPKRIKILQKVYEKIADDQPYTFMFNEKYVLYMRTSRIQTLKPTFKYDIGVDTWFIP